MIVAFVVARATNGVIGRDGGLPWRIPADLAHFKRLTVGKPVLMGRRTFDSIGKPLPGRHNIVLTRTPGWSAPGVTVAPNLAEAIAAAGMDPRARPDALMVIGGAAVYAETLPLARRVYLTEVHAEPEGDTVLPAFRPETWAEVERVDHPGVRDTPAYSFVTLDRSLA